MGFPDLLRVTNLQVAMEVRHKQYYYCADNTLDISHRELHRRCNQNYNENFDYLSTSLGQVLTITRVHSILLSTSSYRVQSTQTSVSYMLLKNSWYQQQHVC